MYEVRAFVLGERTGGQGGGGGGGVADGSSHTCRQKRHHGTLP